MRKITNRVDQSAFITIDIQAWRPKKKRMLVDLKPWLYQDLVLCEKEFRAQLKAHRWAEYTDAFVALDCSSKAILPAWAYMLVTTYLQPHAAKVVRGSLELLEDVIYQEMIQKMDVQIYQNARVLIKGCSGESVPENAYLLLIQKLQPLAHSIMYGEACSTVPLFKRTTLKSNV